MFDNSKISDISIIKPAERVEGCELVKMSRDKDPNSKSYRSVTFNFKEKITGAELAFREFAPNRIINGKTLDSENFKKNIGLAHARIAHITRAFLDEATFLKINIQGDLDQCLASNNYSAIDKAWDDYIQMTGAALGASEQGVVKAKGIECALKVIYNGKYVALPKVPPFISTVNHPKVFSTNPQYDKYTQDKIVPDQESVPVGDFSQTSTNHPSGF